MQNSTAITAVNNTAMAHNEQTTPQSQYKANRQKLIELSILARQIREREMIEDSTINAIIRDFLYIDENNVVFNGFWEWKEKGFKVKKGEKAFLFWGKKTKNIQDREPISEDEKVYSFFPLAYLFSNNQVELINK